MTLGEKFWKNNPIFRFLTIENLSLDIHMSYIARILILNCGGQFSEVKDAKTEVENN